jgi:hypothetical protein
MKLFLKSKKIISSVLAIIVILLIPLASQAIELIPKECTEVVKNTKNEIVECGVCQLIQVGINFVQILFGLMGGIALIMLIWAGFGLVMSAGNPEKITANKKIIMGTIVGILIMLFAWEAVNIGVLMFTGQTDKVGKIFTAPGSTGQAWAESCPK